MQKILLISTPKTTEIFQYNRDYQGWNSGNLVFINAITSYFYSNKINCTIKDLGEISEVLQKEANWARENFDIAIFPEANIFNVSHIDNMLGASQMIKKLKIPVFILGAGAQSTIDYSFDFLPKIESASKQFLDAIFESGGNITLRGYFTQEVLNRLGYPNCFVSGCPSLYYNGRDYEISNDKVSKSDFKAIFNGDIKNLVFYDRVKTNSNQSLFYEQNKFYDIIWDNKNIDKNEIIKTIASMYRYKMLKNNQIRLFYDYKAWADDLVKNSPSFSYGQRIHGNIICLLNNIPAFVDTIDSRTRELTEFYKIPNSFSMPFDIKKDSLYDLYLSLDWTDFNKNLKEKFDNFQKFFIDNNISTVFGDNAEYKKQQESLKYKTPEISTSQLIDDKNITAKDIYIYINKKSSYKDSMLVYPIKKYKEKIAV